VRALHVMPSLAREFGGPVEALTGYVAASALSGATAAIVAPWCSAADLAALRESLPRTTQIFPVGPRRGPAWLVARSIGRAVRELVADADVVHVHGLLNPVSAAGAHAALSRGAPLIIAPLGTLSPYTFAHRRVRLKRAFHRLVDAPHLRSADALHFASDRELEEAGQVGFDIGTRAYVVPPVMRQGASVVRRHRPVTGRPCVLFLSRLDLKKGLDLLLDAWPSISARRPGVELAIAGSGRPRYEAAIRARVAGLGPGVTLLGFVGGTAKERCLAGASVAVLPSAHENFGIAVLDALGAGVPVVVTRGVALSNVIAEEGLGVVVERSATAIADGVEAALEDEMLCARAAISGPVVAERRFGIAAIAPALAAMYEGAVGCRDARMDTTAVGRL
jgi:glycosyltransferase involved in cell wall biosynthesis